MGVCSVTSKFFMTVISLIFWGAAAGLIFVGAWVFKEYRDYSLLTESLYTLVPATILIAVGFFFFLLGIVGCVGACKEQKCLLGLFFTILLIIFAGMVASFALGFVFHNDVDESLNKGFDNAMSHYNDSAIEKQFNFMQQEMKCCGKNNYSDWASNPFMTPKQPFPDSCCKNSNCTGLTIPTIPTYTKGCYTLLRSQFMGHLKAIIGVSAAFAVVQILGMIFSCALLCRRKEEVPYIGLNDPQGLRV